jgi:hypothetical protein
MYLGYSRPVRKKLHLGEAFLFLSSSQSSQFVGMFHDFHLGHTPSHGLGSAETGQVLSTFGWDRSM